MVVMMMVVVRHVLRVDQAGWPQIVVGVGDFQTLDRIRNGLQQFSI